MADVTQTAANVHPNGSNAAAILVQVGEAVVQGDVGYYKTSDGKHWKCDADLSTEAASAKGIFITPAAIDGYAYLQVSGSIDVGGTLVVGTTYLASANAGKIMPTADLASGDYNTRLGVASATDKLELSISVTGIQVP